MCITTSAARLTKTLIYTGEGNRNDELVHVLAYQNNASSRGPNSMVLPFPTSKEMTADNIIDTRAFPKFLRNISDASKHMTLSANSFDRRDTTKGMSRGFAQVFESGSYTVVLAEDVSQIPEALTRVPENKRPVISEKFLHGYGQLYPNQPIAVCCWDGTIQSEPLLWWYTPKSDNHLFLPTMDAHDGNAPRLSDAVETDHIISVGSVDESKIGQDFQVFYREQIPDHVKSLLPKFVYGTKMGSTYKNGDMFVGTSNLGANRKTYADSPKAYRGVAFAEASISGTEFALTGWM